MPMTTTSPHTSGPAVPFGVLRVATARDQPCDLYPQPGAWRDTISLTADDGDSRSFRITGIQVCDVTGVTPRTITQIPELRATLHVTEARVAVASTRYDLGRGWRGTAVGALLASAADSALGASASRGRCPMLVGHLLLTWVVSVHARRRPSLVSPHTLAIGYRDPTTRGFGSLTITLDRRVRAARLAREIAVGAARAQARDRGIEPDLRVRLTSFARSPISTTSGALVAYALPHPPDTHSARSATT
jgi:hypothetical protein